MGSVKKKNLALAIGLNIVLPGLGYMYMGRIILGIGAVLYVLATIGVFAPMNAQDGPLILVLTWFGLNLIMLIDMILLHSRNRKRLTEEDMKKRP